MNYDQRTFCGRPHQKTGHGGGPHLPYELCIVVAKRTRQIIEQMQSTGATELPGKQKEIVVACNEIMNGKFVASKD